MQLTEKVHKYLSAHLVKDDRAIDATAGNGYDTVHMAEIVGAEGQVIAIDIQETAIAATRERLKTKSCLKQTECIVGEHSEILKSFSPHKLQTISAITFNLGYLPGSNKRVQTFPQTTLAALDESKVLLKQNGLLLVTAYRGHTGGLEEAEQVAQWMQANKQDGWSIASHEPTQKSTRTPPILWVALKTVD